MRRIGHTASLLMIVVAGDLGAGCSAPVKVSSVRTADGRQEYSVVCRDNYNLCVAAENKVCPQGHSDLSYSDQVPFVDGHLRWDHEFVCKSSGQ
jgi:hypothetical protein